jgi:hypothetical protein
VVDIVALRRRTDHPTGVAGAPGLARVIDLVRSAGLTELVRPAGAYADQTDPAGRVLPVLPELRRLLPWGGLRRGATVAIATGDPAPAGHASAGHASAGHAAVGHAAVRPAFGATSVLLALLAAASADGSWCAVVGMPALGARAAAEIGVALDRLALVPHPGTEWPGVVAALLDGFDVVVAAPPGPVGAPIANRLAARARQRGSVLVPYGRWPGADVVLSAVGCRWHGLGQGRGRLRQQELVVSAVGRGAAARVRRATLWLPGGDPPESTPTGLDRIGPEPMDLDRVGLGAVG